MCSALLPPYSPAGTGASISMDLSEPDEVDLCALDAELEGASTVRCLCDVGGAQYVGAGR